MSESASNGGVDIVCLDDYRPHVNELQICTECFKRQISTHLASVQRKYWECTHCGEMAATMVESYEQWEAAKDS